MIERAEDRFGLKPERLVADTAYGAAFGGWMLSAAGAMGGQHEQDKSRQTPTATRSARNQRQTSKYAHPYITQGLRAEVSQAGYPRDRGKLREGPTLS